MIVLPCKQKCQLCTCGACYLEKVNKDPQEDGDTHCASMLDIGICEVISCVQGSRL